MGHSQSSKETTHRKIVAIAAKRFREKGLDGAGVAALMKEAGLTVGGFYKHFASRDDLVAEALGAALGGWQKQQEAGETLAYGPLVDAYLSEAHRDHPGDGCAFSALAPDIARSGPKARQLATEQIQRDIALLAPLLPQNKGKGGTKAARARAILAQSALVGALALSRAVSDKTLSREILQAVRDQLKEPTPDRAK